MSMMQTACRWHKKLVEGSAYLIPVWLLVIRLHVAWFFFKAGLSKIESFDSTVMLFEHVYTLPVLSPYWAALLATTGELVLPVLVAFGLLGRLGSLALFILNVVAVLTYPDLWLPDYRQAMFEHIYLGMLLLAPVFLGPGFFSLDRFLFRYCNTAK